jgi:hypothetical protein
MSKHPATGKARNVIVFPRPKANRLRKARAIVRAKKHIDHAFIAACVAYVQNTAAFNAGFEVDGGNYMYASADGLGGAFNRAAERALVTIAKEPARSVDGLLTKAKLVEKIVADYDGSELGEGPRQLFAGFAEDVRNYLRTVPHAERAAPFEKLGAAPQAQSRTHRKAA